MRISPRRKSRSRIRKRRNYWPAVPKLRSPNFVFLTPRFFLALVLMLNTPCLAAPQRMVLLGDSITDGHSYPLMVRQALDDAGKIPPRIFNAGVGGDTASGMSTRQQRDGLVWKPDCVFLNAGSIDAQLGVTLEEYSRAISEIVDWLRHEKITLVLPTTAIYGAQLRRCSSTAHLRIQRLAWLARRARPDFGEFESSI